MKIYIIDTNLIFSVALNVNSGIAKFIFSSSDYDIELVAPTYLKFEMESHLSRLAKIAKLSPEEVKTILSRIYAKLSFVEDRLIPLQDWITASRYVKEVDPKDIVFVALTEFIDETFLTGDLKLFRGLLSKGFTKITTFPEIKELYNIT